MGPPTKTYKPIQPAPSKRDRSGGTSGRGDPVVIISSIDRPTKRLKAVLQACHTCRKFKARCDGQRPFCGGCVSRGKTCGYEGSEGQSRQAAVKTRMEHFVKCWTALQTSSPDEALELFNRIRAGEDEMALLNSGNDDVASGVHHSSSTGSGPTVASRSSASASTSGSGSDTGPLPSSLSRTSRSASDAPAPALTMSEYSSSSLTLVQSSSTSPSQTRVGTAAYLFQFVLPSAESILSGVQSFFGSSGRLFHVFSQAQAEEYYKTVFGFDGRPNHKQRKAICCLCIIAAIGVQYNPSDFEQATDDLLYHVARQFFTDVMEDSPLEAIKVCTLLAMYNIMNKATSALAYIEVGLSMSKGHCETTGVMHPSPLSQDEWVDFRKTWRTLMFFSSWLSSTLGYISGPDRDDAAFQKLVPLADLEHDIYTVEIGEMVQAEMTKISLLKASILRTRLIKELTSSGIDGIVKELQEWHGRLPPQMQLATLGDFDIPSGVRWSIYHVHLLYLGAIILVYRRVAAQCMRASSLGDRLALNEHNNALMGLVELGVNAARDSARILGLLHADKGIFRRCWLVIFQAHTSCVVILHSVAQKQLHKFPASSWAEDMKRAQNCLDVLEFCGTIDAVALRFRIKLSSFYNELSTTGAERHTNMQRVADWVQPPPDHSSDSTLPTPTMHLQPSDYLLTIPRDADQHLQNISYSLMFAICRPWGEVENMKAGLADDVANLMLEQGNAGDCDESSADRSQLLAELDWNNVQKVQPFQWDMKGIVNSPKAPEVEIQEAMFLGSEAPSGWSSTPYIEVDEA